MAEFLALVLRGTGEEDIKKQGKMGLLKIKKIQNYTHTPTLQDHFPEAQSPLNYEDSCVRYYQNFSITKKKTSKKGFCTLHLTK